MSSWRHSVDSVASYSSQNHVDRIRTQNFSAASCQDEGDFGSIKTSLFRRSSSSNLEYPVKRPESVTSNTSSTRSRLRELVERKSSQDEHKSAANTVADIQYFENPTEKLEFDNPRSSLDSKKSQDDRPKKRKLSKSKDKSKEKDKEICDNKNKKHEKYQSKLAEYYKFPVQLPQDEFYQHLTRSRAAEELLQKRFSNSDTEFSGSYGRLCKHKELEGSNLRRSRSLAVIREETFTDLQIQNHAKSKRSQLIPRARLFDKPCFKDRLPGRAKYQTKEEVLEGIYIDSTASCFGDINGQRSDDTTSHLSNTDKKSDKEDAVSRVDSRQSRSISGSWPNLNEETKPTNLSEDSIGHSRNPSEIDSLDSNYVRKHYNFEAHLKSYKDSSPETERSIPSPSKDLYITTDDHESEIGEKDISRNNSPNNYCVTIINSENNNNNSQKIELVDKINSCDILSIKSKHSERSNSKLDSFQKIKEVNTEADNQSLVSENDGTISSPPDSITSYISISIASSTDKSHKLEYLANSLAEKIDEYCDSQLKDNKQEFQITQSEIKNVECDPIYTVVQKKKTFADIRRDSFSNNKNSTFKELLNINNNETYVSNTYIECDNYNNISNCSSSKNITTEPFVTTLIENQYYSLPDINISKCLRKSERIDAQLREEDPDEITCENTYEVAENNFEEIYSNSGNKNYGQLNKIQINCTKPNDTNNIVEYSSPQHLQNFTRLEDDLKSIITIESSNPEEQDISFYTSNTHQNEREINEIEGTIRNNKLITKSESFSLNCTSQYIPEVKILKSHSNDNISRRSQDKKVRTGIRKHYSLRQRDPTDDSPRLPSPNSIENNFITYPSNKPVNQEKEENIKINTLLSRVQSFKSNAETNIAIVPLSGHQTIVINPPLDQVSAEITKQPTNNKKIEKPNISLKTTTETIQNRSKVLEENTNKQKESSPIEFTNYCKPKDPFITIKLNKIVKKTIPQLKNNSCAKVPYLQPILSPKLDKPPTKLIIKDNKNIKDIHTLTFTKLNKSMTRPQVLQVIDSKHKRQNNNADDNIIEKLENKISKPDQNPDKEENNKEMKPESNNVKEKLNNAIKTDIEYQEKINSVKNYWSKLIDKSPESLNNQEVKEKQDECFESINSQHNNQNNEVDNGEYVPELSVGSIIKSLESVKIVDSIRKISQTKHQLWKDETEKVKSDSEIEETPVEKIFKESNTTIYDLPKTDKFSKKPDLDLCRDTPEIEIVELSSEDQNQKTQATLIKAKGSDKDYDEFDHVRYKVMKSELFKNSMIANYRKEAQFDGLLQYLQDYSFQELLVNNNIVIIEPVRTKVEPAPRKNNNTDACKIPPTLLKKNETSSNEKSKNAIRRHFFYHPIRVNKEIIEEELPDPDTVKKVRNLFEETLKMKSPMTQDPPLVDENVNLTKRAISYRNLSEEGKGNKVGGRKKVIRQLTIDTNFGNKKWDNASLSSGVSSGDLSSTNEYETDGLSPYSQKNLKDNVYSSSDEYLCDSANQDFCCESQYVSPDILKKIRECGTSVTYYGGKVLNSKPGSTVSPMTKAIMDEIKSLQKNCSRDCYSCQTKCKGDKCSCLSADKHKKMSEKNNVSTLSEPEILKNQDNGKRTESFPGFKFKLVKSNSCSSRLELTGTDDNKNPRLKYRRQFFKTEDPPLLNEGENSVKNKICRLESYSKGVAKTPFEVRNNEEKKMPTIVSEQTKITGKKTNTEQSQNCKPKSGNDDIEKTEERCESRRNSTSLDKQSNDVHTFEKKYYYVNDNLDEKKVTTGKFGEMVFEEFEVLESCYDSLNSSKSK